MNQLVTKDFWTARATFSRLYNSNITGSHIANTLFGEPLPSLPILDEFHLFLEKLKEQSLLTSTHPKKPRSPMFYNGDYQGFIDHTGEIQELLSKVVSSSRKRNISPTMLIYNLRETQDGEGK